MQEKTASGVIVYLQEELGDARLRAQQLTHYIKKATELIENSEHRDHFFEVAGHLIYGIPEVAFKLGKALDAAALAAAKLDYEEIKQGLKPEKVEELEEVLNDARLRYLNRRSSMTTYKFNVPVGPTIVKEVAERLNGTVGIRAQAGTSNVYGVIEAESDIEAADKLNAASKIKKLIADRDIHRMVRKATQEIPMNAKIAADILNKLAAETDQTGKVPVAKLASLIAQLESGSKRASDHSKKAAEVFRGAAKHLVASKNPSRFKLAQNLRVILANSDMSTQAGAGEEFQKHNPAITDEQAKKIDEEHEKNKDVVKDKNQ